MAEPILMPKLGQTVTEGTIVTWRKQVGDTIQKGDILFDVETDKAIAEAECFHDGTLLKIVVQEGETVAVSDPVAYVGEAGEEMSGAPAEDKKPDVAKKEDIPLPTEVVVTAKPLSKMRRIIAERLTKSYTSTPHFFVTVSADMTDLLAYRKTLKDQGKAYTVTDFILKAVILSLVEFPAVNSVSDGQTVTLYDDINLGIAVGLEDGLVVPVVRKADSLDLQALHDAASVVVTQARDGKLQPDDMIGSSFTVSNMGMLGVESFTAIINPGEAAILAVSSTQEQAVVIDGGIKIRAMMKMTLSSDHRIVDGTLAAKFMNAVKAKLEDQALWQGLA